MGLVVWYEAILVETGNMDRDGNKIEKPEAVYYYCSRIGGVNLSDQLLNYFNFLRKSTKWSQKLLMHLTNLVILNACILNRHYGSKRMTQDKYLLMHLTNLVILNACILNRHYGSKRMTQDKYLLGEIFIA